MTIRLQKGLQAIASDVWDRGGIVGTVCHGPAILPGVIDSKTGKSIIEGRTVTGFTIEGELIFNILEKLRQDRVVPVVEAVTAVGAYYSTSMNAFDDYSVTSGRVVTGTNPQSGRSTATTNREATFGNLRPGSYRFRVMACNSDGIWNGADATVEFDVRPTLAQTWWFRAAVLMFAGLATLAIYRLRVREITKLLNLRFEERLAERTRIAQELHDTLLQSFQGLILRLQAANQTLLSNPSESKEALEGALDRADQAICESRKAIQGIRSDSFSDGDIKRALSALMNDLAADSQLGKGKRPSTSVIVEGPSRTVNSWACEEICKIAREALANAFKHGNAEHIESEIVFSKTFLRVRFRDDGVGIDPAILEEGARAGHWGLTGMHERAKRLRGHLNMWSKPNAGTEVEMTIPASTAFESGSSWISFNKGGAEARCDV